MGAVAGALTAVTVGFAPSAVAYDAQSKQWYLEPMAAEQMWKVSTGQGVKVAVIDTGVNADTPSLKGQVLVDEVPEKVAYRATDDYDSHGTTMAELIAGKGTDGGLQGLAPGAKIVPYRVELSSLKAGKAEKARTPEPADAIRAAADTDVKIINMSFGGDSLSAEEEAAIKYAASKGKLLIASVGNAGEGNGRISYPAAYPYVLGVSSMDASGTVSKTSSFGNYVDLAAPGEDLPGWCDARFRSYCVGDRGTSASAAITSGSAALIWSVHPTWTANQVVRSLIDTAGREWAKDDPSKYLGYGAIRPRVVLEDADYDAGSANDDPLAKENGGQLATDATPSAPTAASSQDTQKNSTGGTSAAGSRAGSSKDSNVLWIVLGAAGAAIVLGGGGAALARARRAR